MLGRDGGKHIKLGTRGLHAGRLVTFDELICPSRHVCWVCAWSYSRSALA